MGRDYITKLVVIVLSGFAAFDLGEIGPALGEEKSSAETIKTDWGLVDLHKDSAESGSAKGATLEIQHWPDSNELALPIPFPNIVRAYFAADLQQQPLRWKFNADASEINLILPPRIKAEDGSLSSPQGTIIQVLTAENTVQFADGTIVMSSLDAKVDGDRAKLETHPGNHRIGFWSNPADSVSWEYNATRWGMYDVDLVYSTASPDGSEVSVSIGEKSLPVKLKSTGSWYQYTVIPVGRVYLETAGKYPVRVQCEKLVGAAVMNLKAIILRPASEGQDLIQPGDDGKLTLNSRDSTVHGVNLRYEPNPKKLTLGYWSNAHDYATWRFAVKRAGKYRIEVTQGCGKGEGGSQVQVLFAGTGGLAARLTSNRADDRSLEFVVEDTGHFQNFKKRVIGEVELAVGVQNCEVRPLMKANHAVMELQQIDLTPIE